MLTDPRGSGGTNHSTSTGRPYDCSSSTHFSSSSTLPSSTDVPAQNDISRTFHDIPVPPVPESASFFSLRTAGRTLSFGTRPGKISTPTQQQQHQQHQGGFTERGERAMTASSESTATPPKLLDSDLDLRGGYDDNFSKMFESFGRRKSALLLQTQLVRTVALVPLSETTNLRSNADDTSRTRVHRKPYPRSLRRRIEAHIFLRLASIGHRKSNRILTRGIVRRHETG